MDIEALRRQVDDAFDRAGEIGPHTAGTDRDSVDAALELLDSGKVRVAEKATGGWQVHQWLKKAVLLSFRLNAMSRIEGGPGGSGWWDKVPSKFAGLGRRPVRGRASAPCRARSCAARPTSHPAWC